MNRKLLALATCAAVSTPVAAFEFNTGEDWRIRWDNTVKLNAMSRVAKQDKDVLTARAGASWFLADDSDLSVDRTNGGLVSTRLDILSEFDVVYKRNYGFRVSAAGWYDPMYGSDSDHPEDRLFTWASPSVSPGEYTDSAEKWHYLGGEVLDAFVFANFNVGEVYANIRAGRHTIYWGNSLLTQGAIHGIASAMAPLDFNKGLAVPGSEAKELFLPTNKISTSIELTPTLTLSAFYGFEHQEFRMPETGTYFSPAEGLEEDAEFATVVPAPLLPAPFPPLRGGLKIHDDETETGDWGLNFQYYIEPLALDAGFIYMNYTGKTPEGLVGTLGSRGPAQFEIDAEKGTAVIGDAKWLYKDDIDLWGIALAKDIAGVSVGMDIVNRRDAPLPPELARALGRYTTAEAFDAADSGNYGGAYGDTWHVVVNGLGLLNDNGFWEGGSWILEASFSMLDDCKANCFYADERLIEGRIVSGIGGVFRPTWYQVWPGTDMTVPIALSYTIDGEKAPIAFGGDEEGGNASIGVEFDINQRWLLSARYNAFFGPATAGIGGLLKDRDNVSITAKMTF